jgi:hypothetical protein
MCSLAVGKNEATILVNLVDRLDVLPEVWEAWQAGVLDASRVRVLAGATDVLDDDTGAVQRVVRLDRDTARSCGSREALTTAVREALAQAPPLQVDTHDPSEAITAPESLPGTRLDPLPAAGDARRWRQPAQAVATSVLPDGPRPGKSLLRDRSRC